MAMEGAAVVFSRPPCRVIIAFQDFYRFPVFSAGLSCFTLTTGNIANGSRVRCCQNGIADQVPVWAVV